MKAYRYEEGIPHPIEVEVPRLQPWSKDLYDSDGKEVYANSHFATREEAWDALIRNAEAAESMFGRDIATAEKALAEAKEKFIHFAQQSLAARQKRRKEQEMQRRAAKEGA